MHQPVALVAALVAVASLAAGCSDEGDKTGREPTPATAPSTQTAPAPTPVKSDFAEKADAICGRYQAQIDAIPAPATDAELVVAMQQTIPLVKAEIAELRKLKPPAGLTATGGNFVAALERTGAALELLVSSTKSGDATGAQQAVVEADAQTDRARRLARKLGLTVCGAER